MSARGQAHTLEAVVAGLLLLSSVVFALQVTAVTPLSASTSSQHVENQQQALAEGLLARTAESGALRRAVLFWNESASSFHCAADDADYASDPDLSGCSLSPGDPNAQHAPPNDFGAALNETFGTGVAVNVLVHYRTEDGTGTQSMVYRGRPSDNAANASVTLALTDDDVLYDATEERTNRAASDVQFYASHDIDDDGPLFNLLRVEVSVWRI